MQRERSVKSGRGSRRLIGGRTYGRTARTQGSGRHATCATDRMQAHKLCPWRRLLAMGVSLYSLCHSFISIPFTSFCQPLAHSPPYAAIYCNLFPSMLFMAAAEQLFVMHRRTWLCRVQHGYACPAAHILLRDAPPPQAAYRIIKSVDCWRGGGGWGGRGERENSGWIVSAEHHESTATVGQRHQPVANGTGQSPSGQPLSGQAGNCPVVTSDRHAPASAVTGAIGRSDCLSSTAPPLFCPSEGPAVSAPASCLRATARARSVIFIYPVIHLLAIYQACSPNDPGSQIQPTDPDGPPTPVGRTMSLGGCWAAHTHALFCCSCHCCVQSRGCKQDWPALMRLVVGWRVG